MISLVGTPITVVTTATTHRCLCIHTFIAFIVLSFSSCYSV